MTTASPVQPSGDWRHDDVVAGGLRLHLVRAGEGPPVILLHGFPEFWFSWRYQIGPLAQAGFSVLAPDMRGFNTSEKPHGIDAYDIDELVADVIALADRECAGRAFLAGHDWGGIVAWYAAMRHPHRFPRLAIVNAPHPAAFARDFWTTDQWLRSFYLFLFQLPRVPEALLRSRNYRVLDELFRREVYNPDAFAHGETARYREAMSRSGATTSSVNYYRAAMRRSRRIGTKDIRPIEVPTLVLWGERDPHLRVSQACGLEAWVNDLTVIRVPDAGHWLQLDKPEMVSNAMIDFFGRQG